MKEEFEKLALVKNEELKRYELNVDGHTAFIDYKQEDEKIYLIHTESPEELAGRGVAAALVEKTLIHLKENNNILIPLCPYVFAYIKRNREWLSIVREDFKAKFD